MEQQITVKKPGAKFKGVGFILLVVGVVLYVTHGPVASMVGVALGLLGFISFIIGRIMD